MIVKMRCPKCQHEYKVELIKAQREIDLLRAELARLRQARKEPGVDELRKMFGMSD